MKDDLPSITSLQAFVRAAQLQSFKDAAAALHVSASALSRQVQGLENHISARLFIRRNPGLELTESGQRYLTTVERVLRELREAERALGPNMAEPLMVSALESFSAKWLVPYLPEFRLAHPDIEIQIEATLRYADFDRDRVDVAIRFGKGPWGDLYSEPIVDLEFFPVCSPMLKTGNPPLRTPEDLANHVWIHIRQVPDAWLNWTRETGNVGLRGTGDLEFDHVSIALSAAESGQGVALSSPLLCAAEVADGRLCIPFDARAKSAETYHLVCRPDRSRDRRIVAFRDWLVSSLRRTAGLQSSHEPLAVSSSVDAK